MKKIEQLTVGSIVVFTKTPLGSYTSVGTPYQVESNTGDSAYFRNTKTGGGTYDKASMIQFAEFTVQAA